MVFQKSITKSIDTDITKKPDTPQITINNPLDKETFVNGIELILQPEFSQKGKTVILVNDVSVFDENDSEAFFGYAKYPIPLNKPLRRSNDVKIFAWNGTDSNLIGMKANIAISETPEPFQSQAVPMPQDLFNKVVNKSDNIFPFLDYEDQVVTQLINTVGKPNLIILIAAANPTIPTVNDSLNQWANEANTIDLNLGSTATPLIPIASSELQSVGVKRTLFWDFGEVMNRKVGYKARWGSSNASVLSSNLTVAIRIWESPDNVVFTLLDEVTQTLTAAGQAIDMDLEGGTLSLPDSRYFKITYEVDLAPASVGITTNTVTISEVYDFARAFGTAALSFEVLEESTQTWLEYIKAIDIGTITTGQSISKQVGSTIVDDPPTGKFNRFIPSTQTNFRAKLTVTGAMRTAVSIISGG